MYGRGRGGEGKQTEAHFAATKSSNLMRGGGRINVNVVFVYFNLKYVSETAKNSFSFIKIKINSLMLLYESIAPNPKTFAC